MSPEAQFWIETIALWQPLNSAFLFVWGAGDPVWLLVLKRIFLVMPLGAVALAYWTTVLSLPTIVVRAKRRMFVNQVLVTWWDLARATFTSDRGSLAEVAGGAARLFDPESPRSITDAIEEILSQPDEAERLRLRSGSWIGTGLHHRLAAARGRAPDPR